MALILYLWEQSTYQISVSYLASKWPNGRNKQNKRTNKAIYWGRMLPKNIWKTTLKTQKMGWLLGNRPKLNMYGDENLVWWVFISIKILLQTFRDYGLTSSHDKNTLIGQGFGPPAINLIVKSPRLCLSVILSFFHSFLSNFPQQRKAHASVPKREWNKFSMLLLLWHW